MHGRCMWPFRFCACPTVGFNRRRRQWRYYAQYRFIGPHGLVIKSSGMPNNKEFRERLLPQVLTGLITETVQIQEAERLDIQTSAEEIEAGFAKIAEENNLKPEQFQKI